MILPNWPSKLAPFLTRIIFEGESHNLAKIPDNFRILLKGPFKYYVIKEVGGWGQKMAFFDDLQ